MVPRDVTVLILEDELAGAQAWAERHNIALTWDIAGLEVRAIMSQSRTNESFYLRGRFDDYREVAPAWTFTDASWTAEPHPHLFPRPVNTVYGASIFHSKPVICVPFNRLAYAEYQGPHSNWGGPVNWLTAGQASEVKAHYCGDMLQVVFRDLLHTSGRMG